MGLFNFIKAKKIIKQYAGNSIIMFSEGKIYYTTNKPVIDEIIKEKHILYITIDENDELLDFQHSNFHSVYLDFDFWGQLLMATIKGRLLITTTPSINVLSLKKSPNLKHYSYFMHAPVDIHSYQKNSFDYYDSIVCVGEFQKDNLIILEEKRKLNKKEKVVLGFPYADLYMKEAEKYHQEKNTVLIAPSWGDNSFLNYIDYDIFEVILNSGYNIIYRPHPMSYKYEPEKIENIINKYSSNKSFLLDKNISGIKSMKTASIMVSAISGVIIDYMLFSSGSVIKINIPEYKQDNLESLDLNTKSWESKVYDNLCISITNKQELENILKNTKDIDYEEINKYKKDIANLGSASKEIASYYINLIEKI